MQLHFQKLQLLSTGADTCIQREDGQQIATNPSMEYLGACVTTDAQADHELNRRIGAAKGDFQKLETVWKRSALTWHRKLHIFHTLVQSKLLFALSSLCLTAPQQRRLNGFQCRCIRRIIGIAPSYISRISNKEVLRKAVQRTATELLLKQQLQLLGKVLRAPEGHPMRVACFIPGTLWPATERYVRRRGRPCKEWAREMMGECTKLFGTPEAAVGRCSTKLDWNAALKSRLGF